MLWAALVLTCLLHCLTIEETENMDIIQTSFALVSSLLEMTNMQILLNILTKLLLLHHLSNT